MDLMSSAQLLSNVGEFVGAVAVVLTLVYLAIQVRIAKSPWKPIPAPLMKIRGSQSLERTNLEQIR